MRCGKNTNGNRAGVAYGKWQSMIVIIKGKHYAKNPLERKKVK